MADLPITITTAGAQPRSPADILAQLLKNVAAVVPGYTANLPGSLIEDISSTDVASISLCDSAFIETINSLTPYAANAFLLQQLGVVYGVQIGAPTDTSVYVVFTGPAGFVIAQGFTVSDGTYQYVVQDGGIIGSGGESLPLYCVATQSGSWAVPSGTVQQLITSVPSTIALSVNNPEPGVPAVAAESEVSYRGRVMQAGLAASQGMARYLKTLLANVPGVVPRLISVQQKPNNGGWEVICGGGDPYQVGGAIFNALFDINTLVGSVLGVTGVTNANPGVVTTNLNHGFTTGQIINISGMVGPIALNNTPLTIIVLSPTSFSIGVNTTNTSIYPPYISGGVVTPNFKNITVTINDYPDVYIVPFVNPPAQQVAIALTWNTIATNFVNPVAVAQLGTPALVEYVNSVNAGAPMNLFELQTVFMAAISSIIAPQLLTRMVFSVSIDGIGVSPSVGTGIIAGDPESYFLTNSSLVTIAQG